MKGNVAVIVPRVVCHNLDPHTGIPFMPHMAAHLAGVLHHLNYDVSVIDCFGLQPNQRERAGASQEFMLMGVDEDWVVQHLPASTRVAFIYCRTMAEFVVIERMCAAIRQRHPSIRICLFENVQAVTSFSLRHVASDFMQLGCDVAILGEPEDRVEIVTKTLIEGAPLHSIPGVVFQEGGEVLVTKEAPLPEELDVLPLPLWERFPLEGYWAAGFAHAPKQQRRFLPILTSRGCPYSCTFCIAPEVSPRWRGRTAEDVVDEMEHFQELLGVSEFHVSDLDPTVSDVRTRKICSEIIRRGLKLKWMLAQGTKIETIKSDETLELMAQAGCQYVSFSPESGSPRILRIMNKPFNHEHGLRMARKMAELRISTQACFIAGVPGETEDDRQQSLDYARKLLDAGVNEIAVFIFTPVPGSALAKSLEGFTHYSQCTPSPTWRRDYAVLRRYRRQMYVQYFLSRLKRPREAARILLSLCTGRYHTKAAMSLSKQAKLYVLWYAPWLFRRLDAESLLKNALTRPIIRDKSLRQSSEATHSV